MVPEVVLNVKTESCEVATSMSANARIWQPLVVGVIDAEAVHGPAPVVSIFAVTTATSSGVVVSTPVNASTPPMLEPSFVTVKVPSDPLALVLVATINDDPSMAVVRVFAR